MDAHLITMTNDEVQRELEVRLNDPHRLVRRYARSGLEALDRGYGTEARRYIERCEAVIRESTHLSVEELRSL